MQILMMRLLNSNRVLQEVGDWHLKALIHGWYLCLVHILWLFDVALSQYNIILVIFFSLGLKPIYAQILKVEHLSLLFKILLHLMLV
jgi:hypothetical protein